MNETYWTTVAGASARARVLGVLCERLDRPLYSRHSVGGPWLRPKDVATA